MKHIDWIVIGRVYYGVDELNDGQFAVVSCGPTPRDELGDEGVAWARHGIFQTRDDAARIADRLAQL